MSAFETTQWTVILRACGENEAGAREALEHLYRAYHRPLCIYLQRAGHPAHEAQDFTQQFFETRILSGTLLEHVDRARGRFRSYLLTALQNMVHDERKKAQALKAGGAAYHLPLDAALEVPDAASATLQATYDRAWASALLECTYARLRESYQKKGRARLFEELTGFLPGAPSEPSYEDLATRLERPATTLRKDVSRLRQEFMHAVRLETARTLEPGGSVDDELRYLLSLFKS